MSSAINEFRRLLRENGIYDQAIKLLKEHANLIKEDGEDTPPMQAAYSGEAEISAKNWPLLQEKIAKLNNKAKKLNVPVVVLTLEGQFYKNIKTQDDSIVKELYYKVSVTGEAPKVSGFKFLATINHDSGGNIIRLAPGEEHTDNIKAFYSSKPDYCDHCHKVRHRIDTFIVKGPDGELKQVGRNCLSDFLGGRDPKSILFWFSLRDAVQDAIDISEKSDGGYGARGFSAADTMGVLKLGAAIIRNFGYSKRPTDEDQPEGTGQIVYRLLFNRRYCNDKWIDAEKSMNAEDAKTAEKVVNWFMELPQEQKDNNNFMHNLDVILKSPEVSAKNIGYLVALFPAYARAMDQIKSSENRPEKSNEWLGAEGQKITAKVKVVSTRLIDGAYGTTQMVKMEDENGNNLTWFNSGANRLEDGASLTITGTVKKHDTYQGQKQTMLTRVKAI